MTTEAKIKEEKSNLVLRPPVVVVMGHIDHGKTTLLDRIRKSKVAEKEAGGITQAIGAYQIEHSGKKITFIDTPGHEAFSAMRRRGAHVADIAILVVAADEGLKPQTEEALGIINESELPFVVAINKIDRNNSDPNRVKKELAEKSVLVEGYGGRVPIVELSAKTGEGVDGLLETILLLAELEELKYDPEKNGSGVVIESHLDPRRGAAATILVEDGTVSKGDFIIIGGQVAPVRICENFLGQPIDSAQASEPICIAGFGQVPELGEKFVVFKTREEAERRKNEIANIEVKAPTPAAAEAKMLVYIVLKTDVLGSKEAAEEILRAVASPELASRILKSEVGDVNESDVKLAAASKNTLVVGFKVGVSPAIRELAERNKVRIILSEIIYELVDEVKRAMLEIAPTEARRADQGQVKILALFKEEKGKQIIGGRMNSGKVGLGARFDIVRNNMKVGSGKIVSLQSQRADVSEVTEGNEFGMLVDADMTIAVGDTLEIFTEEKVLPTI